MTTIPDPEPEDEQTPENDDPWTPESSLDDIETDLPVSEEFPPAELQERLEQPTTIIHTEDEFGNEIITELDPVTEPGVEPVWSETDEMVNWEDGSWIGNVSLDGGQIDMDRENVNDFEDLDADNYGLEDEL